MTSPRMEDVALQQLKTKQCFIWLKEKLSAENITTSTKPKVYRIDITRGQKPYHTTVGNQGESLKVRGENLDGNAHQNDKTIHATLMESLVVDGCGVKFYKKSSPNSYTRIWTTPVNRKMKSADTGKVQPISTSLFAVTCFLKLRQTKSTVGQKDNRQMTGNQWSVKGSQYGAVRQKLAKENRIAREREKINQPINFKEKKESKNTDDTSMGYRDSAKILEMERRQRVHINFIHHIEYGLSRAFLDSLRKEPEYTDAEKQTTQLNKKSRRSLIWWFKVIKAVCRLALDMKILSMSRTDNDASSEAYYQYVVGPKTDVKLFFDKRLFSRKRGSQVPLWAQAIAIKKPHARTDKELNLLNELMMSVRSYREKFEFSMRKLVCRVFRYTNCERGRIVIRQSHIGLGFFLVFSGSLYVQKETSGKSGRKQTDMENIIHSGQYFGEVALLGDGHRTATVICREPSELFYIERDDFTSICPNIFDEELTEKIKFAQKFSFFHGWEATSLQRLCLLSQILYISYGQVLEDDWLKTQYLYFLMQGHISLRMKFRVSSTTKLRSNSSRPRSQQSCVAVIGHLHAGDHSELAVLNSEENTSGVSMLSEGVRVLRISKKNMVSLGSATCIQKFFQKYTPRQIPSEEELCKTYHESSKWNQFTKQILNTQLLEKNGAALAFIPATSKGSARRERNTPSPFEKYPEFFGLLKHQSVTTKGLNQQINKDIKK